MSSLKDRLLGTDPYEKVEDHMCSVKDAGGGLKSRQEQLGYEKAQSPLIERIRSLLRISLLLSQTLLPSTALNSGCQANQDTPATRTVPAVSKSEPKITRFVPFGGMNELKSHFKPQNKANIVYILNFHGVGESNIFRFLMDLSKKRKGDEKIPLMIESLPRGVSSIDDLIKKTQATHEISDGTRSRMLGYFKALKQIQELRDPAQQTRIALNDFRVHKKRTAASVAWAVRPEAFEPIGAISFGEYETTVQMMHKLGKLKNLAEGKGDEKCENDPNVTISEAVRAFNIDMMTKTQRDCYCHFRKKYIAAFNRFDKLRGEVVSGKEVDAILEAKGQIRVIVAGIRHAEHALTLLEAKKDKYNYSFLLPPPISNVDEAIDSEDLRLKAEFLQKEKHLLESEKDVMACRK